ncbi:GNAT family N-acetyltransferase [Aquibacillus rhizosphaerae]|uniref:GNAT family N-acetyltransferase n=1 Tax=Aquibacillus rhizosphaerae TaxID=3051431 RepID=A0ABT7L3L1_9BACI|nr:GNAT family N-acetyltransferase [Aquibacillus sp. LR5S19]MDL4840452.1 GNAT family N-acetyltransferase [Aquibacillus sp. LR5S19]
MEIESSKDFQTIAKLNKSVHDLHYQLYPSTFKKYNYAEIKSFFKNIIEMPNFIFLLLKEEDNALGYAWAEVVEYPENPFRKSYTTIYVHQLCVVESVRGMGYGTKLMEEIYAIGKQKKAQKIELDYWTNNDSAHNFYKSHGFKKIREFVYLNI